jgi:hypothetical protein
MKDRGGAVHLRHLVGDYPDLLLWRAALAYCLLQICQGLDNEQRADHRSEELVKEDRFIQCQRLQERFVKQRRRPHLSG